MRQITEPAYAKLNLTLDVLGKRADGYHELKMVMQSVSLGDNLTLTLGEGKGIRLATDWGFLPTDGKNIAVSAANAFSRHTGVDLNGLSIKLEKHIPVCAGTAGGSSDGAAVLRGLNKLCETNLTLEQLAKIGEEVGSDVPYCVLGGTMLAEGRGEILNRLPALPDCWIVMCKPGFAISTPELFHKLDSVKVRCRPNTAGVIAALEEGNLADVSRMMYNVFEDALPTSRAAVIQEIRNILIQNGALGACLSGTGPTTFGIFQQKETAEIAMAELKEQFKDVFLVRPV
ncbi:MAG: 4-(cytidine 5'-diphospho)-2-C-methyl-D-erythritol kinase [Oscillospiraceae bacterium]|nr:4-(cytidine 5'-diphospho)-2-C-methyl-D-erythritol kinase [Oscillospiraceae bacterium]